MKVVVTGAGGLLGGHLVTALRRRGDTVIALSRHHHHDASAEVLVWDPVAAPLPVDDDVSAIVNLAGEGIADSRWSEARKHAIRNSRVLATRRCVEAVHAGMTLVSGSSAGYYGQTDTAVAEDAPPGRDFLAATCVAWEAAAHAAERSGARVVILRTGIILACDGGALPRLRRPTRLGLGGALGDGRQWWSWIHIDDAVGLILHCLDTTSLRGPINVTSPAPAPQREVAHALARTLHRPSFLRTPAPLMRLLLGESADILLAGRRAFPAMAIDSGYQFQFAELEPAIRDLYGSS